MLKFDEATHTYTVNGRVVPSVTQIMGSVGVKKDGHWNSITGSEFCANEVAADFGKALHAIAAFISKGIEFDFDPSMTPWVYNLKKFLGLHPTEIIDVEMPLYSEIYRYCGTPDRFCMWGKKPLIIDWKSATAYQEHWRMQLAAYAQLVKEEYKLKVLPATCTVMISEKGYKTDMRERMEVQSDFNRFMSVHNVYKMAA